MVALFQLGQRLGGAAGQGDLVALGGQHAGHIVGLVPDDQDPSAGGCARRHLPIIRKDSQIRHSDGVSPTKTAILTGTPLSEGFLGFVGQPRNGQRSWGLRSPGSAVAVRRRNWYGNWII